ncbi:MAG: hypothetical protein MRZ57_08065 [Bacteroidales bacterium]|nr:hypothetical protein [Bacteroidales bacterium]
MKRFVLIMACVWLAAVAKAQFCIIDDEDKQPLPGVYVFNDKGKLLTMSDDHGMVKDAHGKVTLSMIGFEKAEVDADHFADTLSMKVSRITLPNVMIGNDEYIKISGALRDVYFRNDTVVLYREGLVDFYMDVKKKKITRRIRACRQYDEPKRKNHVESMYFPKTIDLKRFHSLEGAQPSETHGDTIVYATIKNGRTVQDGMKKIKLDGLERVIIDNVKHSTRTSVSLFGFSYAITKDIGDFVYRDNGRGWTSLVSYRKYGESVVRESKKSLPIDMSFVSDFVIVECKSISKEEAKQEMKDKTITRDFALPDAMLASPIDDKTAVSTLIECDFHE